MKLKEAIENRRSIRKFDNTNIKRELVEEILYDGNLAPSGKNKQPWIFVVLQNDPSLKCKIVKPLILTYNQ